MDITDINLNKFINLEYVYRNIVLNNISSKNFVLMIVNILNNIENLNISQVLTNEPFITRNEHGDIIFNIKEMNLSSFDINELLNDLSKLISMNKTNHNIILNFDKCKFNETVVQYINNNETVNEEDKAVIRKDKIQVNFKRVNFYKASLERYNLNDFEGMYYVNKRNNSAFRECSFNDNVVEYIFDMVDNDTLNQEISTILKDAKTRYIDLRNNYVNIATDQLQVGTKISANMAKQIIDNDGNNRNCLRGFSLEKEYIGGIDLRNISLTGVNINGARLDYEQIQQIINGQAIGRAKGDLRRLDLSNMNLSEFDLSNVDLTGANLNGAILNTEQVRLIIDGNLIGRARDDLSNLDLSNIDIRQFDFTGVDLTNTQLSIEQVKLILNGNLTGRAKGDLSNLDLSGLCFGHETGIYDLIDADFTNTNLNYTRFININIQNTNFENASLQNAEFVANYISDSSFKNAYINRSRIVNTDFYNCNFTDTSIQNSGCQHVHFRENCIFERTNFSGTNLSHNVNIRNIKFTADNIIDILNEKIMLNNNTNLKGLNLTNMDQRCCEKLIEVSNEKNFEFSFNNSKPSIELVKNMFEGRIPGRNKYDLSNLDFSSNLYFVGNERRLNEIFDSYTEPYSFFSWFRQSNFINLTDSNLQGLNLNGLNSKRVKLERANLKDSNLVDCDLTKAELNGAKLNGAILNGTKFTLNQFRNLMDSGNFIEQQNIDFIKNFGISEKEKVNFARCFINKKIGLYKDKNRTYMEICSSLENTVAESNNLNRLENILAEVDAMFNNVLKGTQHFSK